MPAETHSNQPVTREEILSIIQSQLGEILEKDGSSISLSDTFEALEALEDELSERAAGFHIDDEDLEDLKSVGDAVDYVAAKLQVA